MAKVIDAILAINPSAEVSIGGNNVDNIQWLNGTAEISKADIEAKQTELETAYSNNKYQRDRAVSYKQLKEQLDLLYHDIDAGKFGADAKTGTLYVKLKAVKGSL